jgi:hypothetical protein
MGYGVNFGSLLGKEGDVSEMDKEVYFRGTFHNVRVVLGTAGDVQRQSVADIALKIRFTVMRVRQPSVVRRNLEYLEELNGEAVTGFYTGVKPENTTACTSWTIFHYADLDWSSAVGSGTGTGKVLNVEPRSYLPLDAVWKPFIAMTSDPYGGFWARAVMLQSQWTGFEDVSGYHDD